MLILRKRQIEALSAPMRRDFENELVDFLRRAFREQCEGMDDPTLRQTIREGIVRAARHAFESDGQVRRWLAMMFTFGRDFDSDPACDWARDILRYGAPSAAEKMERLYKEARRWEHRGRGLN